MVSDDYKLPLFFRVVHAYDVLSCPIIVGTPYLIINLNRSESWTYLVIVW